MLSAAGLADLAGVTEAEVERMVDRDILVTRAGAGPFLETDVQKVRLATACEQAAQLVATSTSPPGRPRTAGRLPPPAGAGVDRAAGGGHRGGARTDRLPRPARAGAGDGVPGPGRLHAADRGARRPGRRRAGR